MSRIFRSFDSLETCIWALSLVMYSRSSLNIATGSAMLSKTTYSGTDFTIGYLPQTSFKYLLHAINVIIKWHKAIWGADVYAIHIASPQRYFGASSQGSGERTVHLLLLLCLVTSGWTWNPLWWECLHWGDWQMIHVRAPPPLQWEPMWSMWQNLWF